MQRTLLMMTLTNNTNTNVGRGLSPSIAIFNIRMEKATGSFWANVRLILETIHSIGST